MLNYNESKDESGPEHRKSNSTKVLSKTTIPKTRTSTSLKIDHSKDKELINCGLHKLVSSFNTKIGNKPSKTIHKKNEQPDILDRDTKSHIVLSKQMSIDKYTMTDFNDENEKKVNLETTLLNEVPYRDLQWTDPRLLRKYSLCKHSYKKSVTIPYKSECPTEILDEESSELEPRFIYPENKNIFFKCMYYICTASVSFIGSMCGITLITLILWKMLDENMLNFYSETPKSELFFRKIIRNSMGLIFEMFGNIFGKIFRLLTISTNEVFSADTGRSSSNWFKLF